MPRTITANYLNGLQLSDTSDSPVSIAQGVSVASGAGIPLFVLAGDWSITNAGFIQATNPASGTGLGIYLQKGAAGTSHMDLTNQPTGQIIGTQYGVVINGGGIIDNQGTILGQAIDAIRFIVGGTVRNEAGGQVIGARFGVLIGGGGGSIDNQGAISGQARDAVRFAVGGTVENEAGGSLSGNAYGVFIYGGAGFVGNSGSIGAATKDAIVLLAGGTVTNRASTASIGGAVSGIFVGGGLGSVENYGTITGVSTGGVLMQAGGTVSNEASALLDGGYFGVDISGAQGTVTNRGVIRSEVAYTDQNTVFGGVVLGAGGTVTNSAGGTILGTFYGVWTGGIISTVVNGGSISATPTRGPAAAVALSKGGSVTNTNGGTISAGEYGVRILTAAGTVTNSGSIVSLNTTTGAGVALSAGGSVSNQNGATISAGFYGVRLLNVAGAIYNAGSIAGTGTAAGAALGLRAGGSVTNTGSGVISSGLFGILVSGAAGTVGNAGTITSTQTTAGGAVVLTAGGSVTNSAGGKISAGLYGVRLTTTAGNVVNMGSISSAQPASGGGVVLEAGGEVTNSGGGTITSGSFGVRVTGGAGTVVNSAYISSSETFAGAGVDLATGGSVTNGTGGMIAAKWIGVQIGQTGASTGGTFFNQGSVFAGDIVGDGAAVWVHGPGVVINDTTGMIDTGPFNGIAPGGFGIVTYFQTTIINRGVIGGTTAVAAVNAGVGNLVEMAPGASFKGIVQGAKSAADAGLSTLELLSGASVGTISGFGPKYQNFGHVMIDAGAHWRLGGTVVSGTTIALGAAAALTLANPGSVQGTITGFAMGETIRLDGITVTGSSVAGGVLTLSGSSGPISLNLPGNYTTNEFLVTNLSGGGAEISPVLPRTLVWTGGGGAAFDAAANWNDVTNSLNPALSGPDQTDTVEFDISGGAISGTGTVAALDVGSTGTGALHLSNGATVVAGTLHAGAAAGAVGQVGLTGAGTNLTVTGDAIVADGGTGILSILSGATFAAANLTIGALSGSSGALVVSGAGSALNLSGVLNVGTALGIGDLTVGPGAAVHASVINLHGQVVLRGGLLDPTVQYFAQDSSSQGHGTIAADDIIVEGSIEAGASGASEKLLVLQGTVLGGGTLTINGTAQAANPTGVLHIDAGGTLELTGPVLNAAATTFSDGLASASTYTLNNSVIDVEFADGTGVLRLDDIAGFGGTIAAYQAGDAFVIAGGTLSGLGVSNGNTLTAFDSGTGDTDRIIFGHAIDPASFGIVNGNTIVACFAAGTRIMTTIGVVPVEKLCVGDRVITVDGMAEPIIWIGSRTVACASHPAPETVWPVRIRAGAFGPERPTRNLFLSPDHAVFVNEVLVPVKLLINGTSIARMKRAKVTYYHVELPRHDVILAEGLPVESYLVESYPDSGDRTNFAGGHDTIRLFPDFARRGLAVSGLWDALGRAPLVVTGPKLNDARRLVDARAASKPPACRSETIAA